jgi:hypothetical protein
LTDDRDRKQQPIIAFDRLPSLAGTVYGFDNTGFEFIPLHLDVVNSAQIIRHHSITGKLRRERCDRAFH